MFGKNEIVGQKYFKGADKLYVTSVFYTLQGEGPFRGKRAVFIRSAKCNLACSFCFVHSTPILMADGSRKPISEIKVGDLVMSWNGQLFEPKPVTKLYQSVADRLVRVTLPGKKLWVTPEHPFLTSNRGWVNAEDLTTDDVLVNFSQAEWATRFNSAYRGRKRTPMSAKARADASRRLQQLWNDPEFRQTSITRMQTNNPMQDPAVALKGFLSRKEKTKSGLEKRFEVICKDLPIEYVGDGAIHIAHRVPDFLVDGQNKVIEIWAGDAPWAQYRDQTWISKRRQLFEKHGFETLFLPLNQEDMKIANHAKIRETVARFIHNGVRVLEVKEELNQNAHVRLFGSKDAEKRVYNFEVQDNHTYVANGVVVHNCDTYFDGGDWFTIDQLADKAKQTVTDWHNASGRLNSVGDWKSIIVVLTGGEPMLQPLISQLAERLHQTFADVQIESNGTLLPKDLYQFCWLVVSPKCSEKNGKPVKYLKPKPEVLDRADCLKFVIEDNPDSPYYTIPQWAIDFMQTGKEVFISPINVYNDEPRKSKELRVSNRQITLEDRSNIDEVISFWEPGLLNMEQNEKNHKYAAEYCMRIGATLNLQLHLYAGLA